MAGSRGDILAGRAYVELWVKNSAFTRGLQNAKQQLATFGADMQAFGRQMVVMSAAAIIPIAFATKAFADFDDAMRTVKAVTQATDEEFIALTEDAKKLGRETSFTALEVAALKAELGRAGFKPDEINNMTAAVLNLARATSTDATLASGIMAASIRQFQMVATDSTRVADGLTSAANKTFNTVEQLGEALNYAGPVAADFNMSFEDTLAILGGLGNMGIHASNAGTALRRLLTITGAEAEKLNGIFGVTFTDSSGNARPLVDVLGEVNESTKDLGTAARAQKFNEAFGLLGITSASALGHTAGNVKALAEEIKKSSGVAADAAKEMDSGLGGSFRIIMSAAEGVSLAIGEAVSGPIKKFADFGTMLLGSVVKVVEANKEAVVSFAKWALVIGGVGVALMAIGLTASFVSVAIGGLLAIINGMVFAFGLAASVVAIFTSPVTLAVVAIAGIAGAVVQATGSMDRLVRSVSGVGENFRNVFSGVKAVVMQTLGGIRNAIEAGDIALAGQIAMKGLQVAFAVGLSGITAMMGDTMSKLTAQVLAGDFSGAWGTVVLGMTQVWASFSNGIVDMFVSAANSVVDTWRKAVDEIINFFFKMAKMEFAQEGKVGVFGMMLGMSQDEFARGAKLDEQYKKLGMNTGGSSDIGSQINAGTYESPEIRAQADKMKSALELMRVQAEQTSMEAGKALEAGIADGADAASKEVLRLMNELGDLQAAAKKKRDEANAAATDPAAGGGPGAAGAGGIGGAGSSSAKGSSFATFSAAAFLADQGDSSPQVRELKAGNQLSRKALEFQKLLLGANEQLVKEVRNNKLRFA